MVLHVLDQVRPSSRSHKNGVSIALAASVKMIRPHLEDLLKDRKDKRHLNWHYEMAYKGIVQQKKQKAPPVKPTLNTSDVLEF